MSCITNELIQKCIDRETNLEESVSIKNHLASCEFCRVEFETQQNRAIDIKNILNRFVESDIEIPTIIIPKQKNRRRSVIKMNLIYALSAACVMLFFVVFYPNENALKSDEITMLQNFNGDYDANLPATQQKMIINLVDPSGRITEFYVD